MLPRRYRELYRSEGALQAEISGYSLDIKGVTGGDTYTWNAETNINEQQTRTEIAFLLWSDIVQVSMNRSIPATFLLLLKLVWIYVGSGALFRLMRLRKGPVIAALYPIFMLPLQLLVSVIIGGLVAKVIAFFVSVWLGLAVAFVLIALIMRWFRKIDNKLFAYYLLHDYAFSAQYSGANPPQLEDRMQDFANQINAALHTDVDEVLVIGHSSGAHLGVMVLPICCDIARLIPRGRNWHF